MKVFTHFYSFLLTFLRGAILAKGWEWFVVGTWPDLYAISWIEATVLGVFFSFVFLNMSVHSMVADTMRRANAKDGKPEPTATEVNLAVNVTYTISYLLIFGTFFIYSLFLNLSH